MKRVLTQTIFDLPCVPLVWGGVPGRSGVPQVWGGVPGRSGDLITDSLAA